MWRYLKKARQTKKATAQGYIGRDKGFKPPTVCKALGSSSSLAPGLLSSLTFAVARLGTPLSVFVPVFAYQSPRSLAPQAQKASPFYLSLPLFRPSPKGRPRARGLLAGGSLLFLFVFGFVFFYLIVQTLRNLYLALALAIKPEAAKGAEGLNILKRP